MWRALALLVLLAAPARAQEAPYATAPASLVADRIEVSAEGVLLAEGSVSVFHEGRSLTAAAIRYDRRDGRLSITGPILLQEADGTVLSATSATLDPGLRAGILTGARLVLDRRLQLAAGRIERAEDRWTRLTSVAATSCAICGDRPPFWEIRAARVLQDSVARQLWFEDATLRLRGVPVLWLPAIRLPEPGLERSTGLLMPRLRRTDLFGYGLRLPWFVTFGESADLTLTPYLAQRAGGLEARWRQAFARGDLSLTGALARDDSRPGEWRGHLMASGRLDLTPRLSFGLEAMLVTDDAYLLDYGLGDQDRLSSTLTVQRVSADSLLTGDLTYIQSLRETESNATLPPVLARLAYDRDLRLAGGRLRLGAGLDAFLRTGGATGAEGRDMLRAGAFADWRGARILPFGLLLEGEGRLALDLWRVLDDPAYPDPLARATPGVALTLRWPLATGGAGARHVVEPLVAISWARALGEDPPAEDAGLAEFDEGNLTSLTRLPGEDGQEAGARLALGLSWTWIGPGGGTMGLSLGRLWQEDALAAPLASGLSTEGSDWLVSGRIDWPAGLQLSARSLIGEDGPGRSEARIDWTAAQGSLSAAYVLMPEDAAEGRTERLAEWSLSGDWRVNDRFGLTAATRYDLTTDQPARAALGLSWSTECVTVDLSVARRYTSTQSARPSTDVGLSVSLSGFATGTTRPRRAACDG